MYYIIHLLWVQYVSKEVFILSTNQNELVIKILDGLLDEGIEVNEKAVADIIHSVLRDYNISLKENALITTDMPEKIYYFLACKKLEGLSLKTLKNYAYTLKHFSQTVYKPVNVIDIYDLRCYVNERSKTLKDTSAIVWTIKSFFSWLQDEEYITKNPARQLKVPKCVRSLRKGLTVEQVERIRMNCETARERAIVEFLLSTGCRVGELVGLKHTDIVDNSIMVTGKGSKERVVYLNQKATLYLKMYLKGRNHESDHMFIATKKPFKYLGERSIQNEINNIGERIGVNLFVHLFRHTFACSFLENGGNLKQLQDLLGHEDANTTAIYGKMSMASLKHSHGKHAVI